MTCPYPKDDFKNLYRYTSVRGEHEWVRDNIGIETCKNCGIYFQNKGNIYSEVSEIDGNVYYKCRVCGSVFNFEPTNHECK